MKDPALAGEANSKLMDRQALVQALYEGRCASLERFVGFLILFHYMVQRGYTARWLGKYVQEANHIGNGNTFRVFSRMQQYAPHRLPTAVLNRLLGRAGRLRGRGAVDDRVRVRGAGEPLTTFCAAAALSTIVSACAARGSLEHH